jgi:hypothetical protein
MGDDDIPTQNGVARAAQALKDTLDEHGMTMSVETDVPLRPGSGKSGRAKR